MHCPEEEQRSEPRVNLVMIFGEGTWGGGIVVGGYLRLKKSVALGCFHTERKPAGRGAAQFECGRPSLPFLLHFIHSTRLGLEGGLHSNLALRL